MRQSQVFKFVFPCMRCGSLIKEYELLDTAVVVKCSCGYCHTESKADFIRRLEIAAKRLKANYEKEVHEIENLIVELKNS